MKKLTKLNVFLAAVMFGATSGLAYGQAATWSPEQTEVWDVVAQSWVDEVAENNKWPNEYIVDNAMSWGETWPAPRNKASIDKWSRFNYEQSNTLVYENTPLAITIHGDTAVVMYTNVSMSQRGTDKPERSTGGTIETLVKTEDGWKFLALTGFDSTSD